MQSCGDTSRRSQKIALIAKDVYLALRSAIKRALNRLKLISHCRQKFGQTNQATRRIFVFRKKEERVLIFENGQNSGSAITSRCWLGEEPSDLLYLILSNLPCRHLTVQTLPVQIYPTDVKVEKGRMAKGRL